MKNDELRAVLFDVDGVISDTAPLHYQAWRDTVKTLGIDFTSEENLPLKGLPRLDTLMAILRMHGQDGKYSAQKLNELTNLKNAIYVRLLEDKLRPEDILPGVLDFIKKAKEAGLKLAVASTSVNSPSILKKLGVLGYFDFIVDPNSIARGKPDPEIFLRAADGVGVPPCNAMGIEDALPGIAALKAAGIESIAITHGDQGDWRPSLMTLKETSELDLQKALSTFNTRNTVTRAGKKKDM